MSEKAFFDTAVFIYALEEGNEAAMSALEDAIVSDSAVTSTLTVMEYLAGCYGADEPRDAIIFNSFLKDNFFQVRSIDWTAAETAAAIKGRLKSIRDTDAMQIAVAIENGCSVFYTHDKKLLKLRDENIEVRLIG